MMKLLFVVAVALCLAVASDARLNATVEASPNRTQANDTSAQPKDLYYNEYKDARGLWTAVLGELVPHVIPVVRPYAEDIIHRIFARRSLPPNIYVGESGNSYLERPTMVPCIEVRPPTGYQPHVPGSRHRRQFPAAPCMDLPSRAGVRPTYMLRSAPSH